MKKQQIVTALEISCRIAVINEETERIANFEQVATPKQKKALIAERKTLEHYLQYFRSNEDAWKYFLGQFRATSNHISDAIKMWKQREAELIEANPKITPKKLSTLRKAFMEERKVAEHRLALKNMSYVWNLQK